MDILLWWIFGIGGMILVAKLVGKAKDSAKPTFCIMCGRVTDGSLLCSDRCELRARVHGMSEDEARKQNLFSMNEDELGF